MGDRATLKLNIHYGGNMNKVGEDYYYKYNGGELGFESVNWKTTEITWEKFVHLSIHVAKISAPIRFIWFKEALKDMKTLDYALFDGDLGDICSVGENKGELDIYLEHDASSEVNSTEKEKQCILILRSQEAEIAKRLGDIGQKYKEIKDVTQQWNYVPDELKTIEGYLTEKGNGLVRKIEEQRQRSQELQTEIESISEIGSLRKEIAKQQESKGKLTLKASELENKLITAQQEIKALQIQNSTVQAGIGCVQKQAVDKKAELEFIPELLASTTRRLDRKNKKVEASIDRDLRLLEERFYDREEEEKELTKTYEDGKIQLNKTQSDLDHNRKHKERLQKKIDRYLDVLDDANKSIHTISREF